MEYEKGNGFRMRMNLKYLLKNVLVMERIWRKNIKFTKKKEINEDFQDLGGEKLLDILYGDQRFPPYLHLGDNGKKRHTKGWFFLLWIFPF